MASTLRHSISRQHRWMLILWLILSLFLAWSASAEDRRCIDYGKFDPWLSPYPTLQDWYHFYVSHINCDTNAKSFIKILANSEPLSIQLAEAKATFDQCYVPMVEVMRVNLEGEDDGSVGEIQNNLMQIEQCLKKAMRQMTDAERDYFRALVLLEKETRFVHQVARATRLNLS